MGKPIAVQGCTLAFKSGAASTAATLQIVTPPNMNMTADGSNVYAGVLDLLVMGYNGGAIKTSDGMPAGPVQIQPGALYHEIDGDKLVLEEDATAIITFISASTGLVQTDTIYISDAGQQNCIAD